MRKVLVVLGVLALLAGGAAVVFYTVAPVREEVQWRWAAHENSPESYRDFLAAWPTSSHASEARRRYDDRSWVRATGKTARVADEVDALQDYLTVHPRGRHAGAARERVDRLHWQSARGLDTVESYARYVELSPHGRFVAEARRRMEGLHWRRARSANTIAAYNRYIALYRDGRFVGEARREIDRLHWEAVRKADTIVAYRWYITSFRHGRFRGDARRRIEVVRTSDAPFRAAERIGTLSAYLTFLAQFPGHRRTADARVRLLELRGVNLAVLVTQGKVVAQVTGADISEVHVEIHNHAHRTLKVKIPPGTFFVPRNPSVQGMVATSGKEVELEAEGDADFDLPAACANRTRSIPSVDDSFDVTQSPQQYELVRLMPRLARAGADELVRQAAIWIITDNANYDDLGILVDSFTRTRVIGPMHAASAMRIVDRAGIDITAKAIWQDRDRILAQLRNPGLRAWIIRRERA